jgi:hypothetical protein
MTDETSALLADQRLLLQVVYDYFEQHSKWPHFATIDRHMDLKYELDAASLLARIPNTILQRPRNSPVPQGGEELVLTILGISLCERNIRDLDLVFQALRLAATRRRGFEPPPDEPDAELHITSSDLQDALKLSDAETERLCLIMWGEWGIGFLGRSRPATGGFDFTVGRDIKHFARVGDVDEYLTAKERRDQALNELSPTPPLDLPLGQQHNSPFAYGGAEQVAGSADAATDAGADSSYVPAKIVDALSLAADQQSTFNVEKLLGMIEELNAGYAAGRVYSSHMLLRGILDHIPPLYGQQSFDQVVAQGGWGRTDKKYLDRLANFRAQGDDALHRMISRQPAHLDMGDMPERVMVKILLMGCASRLSAASGQPPMVNKSSTSP